MSERPPSLGGDDFRHFAHAKHGEDAAGPHAHAEACPVANGQVREVALRLRSGSVRPPIALTNRHQLLRALLAPGVGAANVRLTYALRHEAPLEVEIAVRLRAEHDAATSEPANAMTKRSLEALCRVIFPGMAAVGPSMPFFEGPMRRLCCPIIDVAQITEASRQSLGPQRLVAATRDLLLLPIAGAAAMSLDSALLGMAEAGVEADLLVEMQSVVLGSTELRALADARQCLVAATYAEEPFGRARALLAEVEAWLQSSASIIRVDSSLRFPAEPQQAIVHLVEGLLYGATAADEPRRKRGVDLSALVRLGADIPNCIIHPLTASAIAEVKRRQRPRSPRRNVIQFGIDEFGRMVTVQIEDLRQHLYIVGQTGVGKSTMLRNIALTDARAGRPVIQVDPHGDLHAEVLDGLPPAVRARTIVGDAADFDAPFSINILEVKGPYAAIQRNFISNQLVSLFKSVYGHNPDAFGPMFEAYFRGALFLLMDSGGPESSLLDLERVFGDGHYRRGLIDRCTDPSVVSFWKNIAQKAGGEASLENIAPYVTSKLSQLAGNPLLRPILCSPRTTLDLPRALAEGRTVLVNLAKGLTGSDAGILGGIVTIRLFAAAMERARLPPEKRRLTRVILDEFQTYGGISVLAEALAEVRKYGLSIVLANQSIAQIDGRAGDIAHAILGNCGNLVAFRVGAKDAGLLAEWLGPEVNAATLMRLPNRTCVARLLHTGEPMSPVRLTTGIRKG